MRKARIFPLFPALDFLVRKIKQQEIQKKFCRSLPCFSIYPDEENSRKPRNWWIGLTDEESEGTWYWSKSNRVAEFTSWGTGQPTNIGCGGGGLPANYGVLAHWVSYNWSDYDLTSALCGSPNYPICQISSIL